MTFYCEISVNFNVKKSCIVNFEKKYIHNNITYIFKSV